MPRFTQTSFATNSLAAIAAVFLAVSSIGAIVSVPAPATAAPIMHLA